MGEEALKKCLILKTCELCMHLERAKIKGISQHLWAEMHMWIHRHLEENSQPLIRVEQQLATMIQRKKLRPREVPRVHTASSLALLVELCGALGTSLPLSEP